MRMRPCSCQSLAAAQQAFLLLRPGCVTATIVNSSDRHGSLLLASGSRSIGALRSAAGTLRHGRDPSCTRPARAYNGVSPSAWSCSPRKAAMKSPYQADQLHRRFDHAVVRSSAAASEGDGPVQTQAPAAARRKRVLSGVQPTGTLHLGNYFGAIRNWVQLQDLYDTYFMMADLHAITMPHEPKELLQSTRSTAALYLACGIDPSKAAVFVQSQVPAHAELAWLLQCYTPIGWLRKMIQFKTKSEKQGEEVGAGLLTYPALMAADILLYQADLVPVGDDQKQHLELTRDLAARFNAKFGGRNWQKMGGRKGRLFTIPEPFIPPAGARVMSLADGTSKMSKSAESDMSRINLLDDPALITKKVKSAKTDTFEGLEYDDPDRPEARNLMTMYALATGMSMESVINEVGPLRWGEFKPRLADALVEHLAPIRTNYAELMKDEGYLTEVLAKGAATANEVAQRTVSNCRQAMGFLP